MLQYLKFLEKVNIRISKGVFITADDDFDYLEDNIFRLPFEWFQLAKSIDEVDLFIERVFEKKIKPKTWYFVIGKPNDAEVPFVSRKLTFLGWRIFLSKTTLWISPSSNFVARYSLKKARLSSINEYK